ncbi:MAG: hypothetical protein PUB19_07990 [Lachnospiraceae bacterium]|nr:hypothetical protein [Lachnospiraceae bacterium]
MKEFDPLREFIFDYITVVAENTLSIAVVGSLFARDVQITFLYFFLPFGLALVCMLPCIPTYLIEDLSIKQIMIQRFAEWIVLEVAIIWLVHFLFGDVVGEVVYIVVFFSVAFFEVLSYVIKGYLEKSEADRVNEALKKLHDKRK